MISMCVSTRYQLVGWMRAKSVMIADTISASSGACMGLSEPDRCPFGSLERACSWRSRRLRTKLVATKSFFCSVFCFRQLVYII